MGAANRQGWRGVLKRDLATFWPIRRPTDREPILGPSFPRPRWAAEEYFYGIRGFGRRAFVEVDGLLTEIGPRYAVGPVAIAQRTPPGVVTGRNVTSTAPSLAPLPPG